MALNSMYVLLIGVSRQALRIQQQNLNWNQKRYKKNKILPLKILYFTSS